MIRHTPRHALRHVPVQHHLEPASIVLSEAEEAVREPAVPALVPEELPIHPAAGLRDVQVRQHSLTGLEEGIEGKALVYSAVSLPKPPW